MRKALVYINWGRLVADCPEPHCTDAREVEIGDVSMTCAAGHPAELEWAEGIAPVLAVLAERTSPKRKNWFPPGHPLAVLAEQPHGQTVRELREEAEAGEAADAQHLADRRAQILEQVRVADIPLEDVLAALKGS